MVKFTAHFTDSLGRRYKRQIEGKHSGHAGMKALGIARANGLRLVSVGRI